MGETNSLKVARLATEAIALMSQAESDVPKLILEGDYLARQRKTEFIRNLRRLVDLARNNFASTDDELDRIREKFGFNGISRLEKYWLYRCLRWILKKDEQLARLGEIDYGDMLYLPHVWNIKPARYDFVLVDELQDANLAQIALYQSLVDRGATFIGVGGHAVAGFA